MTLTVKTLFRLGSRVGNNIALEENDNTSIVLCISDKYLVNKQFVSL